MPGFSYRHALARSKSQLERQKSQADETAILGDSDSETHAGPSQSCGRGIIQDFRTTIGTHWCNEMTTFNTKTIAVSFFMFIAVIAPSITFGAVYAKRTNNYIGAVELLLATGWCGTYYSLVAGMPMMINGGTGPVLTFQAVLYELAKQLDIPFLTFNAWVGIWIAVYMLLAAFFDLNRIIKYATRFTDEVFAFLIVSIFILDAIGNPTSQVGLFHYFTEDHPHNEKQKELDEDYEHMTVALLSLILGIGTAFVALFLRKIRYSSFCCNDYVRSVVTDFAITISVVLCTVLKHTVFESVQIEELNVPDNFAPTFNCCTEDCTSYFPEECPDQDAAFGRRPWVVDLFDVNGKTWTIFMAAGPAALGFILAFLDNGITWHIVNHPSNKISHGEAYNYDTCVSAVMLAINSVLGLPWLVASTVPCIMHVTAMSETDRHGVTHSIQESRLTGFLTHVLVLGTIFALGVIKLIPLPVLYGVFLFMGLVALPAQQFWQRFLLFFQEPSKIALNPYTENLPIGRIHKYTVIQLVMFALLYAVKNYKAISIGFPLFILLCIPVRLYVLPKIFDHDELTLLDGTPEEIEKWLQDDDDIFASTDKDASDKDSSIKEFVKRNGLKLPSFNEGDNDDDVVDAEEVRSA